MRIRRRVKIDRPSPFDAMIAAVMGVDPPTAADYGPRKKVDTFTVSEKFSEPRNIDITDEVKVIKPLALPEKKE